MLILKINKNNYVNFLLEPYFQFPSTSVYLNFADYPC